MAALSRAALVGVLLGLGLLAGFAASQAPTGLRMISSKRWKTKRASVDVPDQAAAFLDELCRRTDLDLVVTSGSRSPESQAQAMRQKIDQGATLADLLALYGDDDQVSALWPYLLADDINGAAAVIQEHVDRGRFLSRHLSAGGDSWAIDLRDPETSPERARLIAVAREMGARVVDEGNHIHIEKRGVRNV